MRRFSPVHVKNVRRIINLLNLIKKQTILYFLWLKSRINHLSFFPPLFNRRIASILFLYRTKERLFRFHSTFFRLFMFNNGHRQLTTRAETFFLLS